VTPRGVLVTGATTPIGERLCRSLLADARIEHVLAVGLEAPESAIPFSHGERLVYRRVDLSRGRRVRNLLFGIVRDLGIECVVHLSMHRSAAQEGGRVHAQNVDALRSLLELSERHPTIKRFVFRSHAEVYQVSHELPILVTEDHPLNLGPGAPQWIRDRVEADLTACARTGLTPLQIVVLRCAEVLGPGTGSQLFDFLDAPVCLRPAGYNPMMNLLSMADAVHALELATQAPEGTIGVFNIAGRDTLPLAECIRKWGRAQIPAPGTLITPIYRLRRRLRGHDFSYGMNRRRFHYASVLEGSRACEVLGYVPEHPIDWPAE